VPPRVGAQYEPDSVWSVIFPLVPGNGNLQAETTAPKAREPGMASYLETNFAQSAWWGWEDSNF
jgi:hypothetical protein